MEDSPESNLYATMGDAIDDGAIPIAMTPYGGPPPNAEFYLELMRDMVTTTGSATGCLCFGTEDSSGMFPLINCTAQEGLQLLVMLRHAGAIDSVTWVTLASDSYRKVFTDITPEEVKVGDLARMYEEGDAEVEEVLMVTCLAPDGPGYDVTQPYQRTEDGIAWGEITPIRAAREVGGGVHELMDMLVKA